MSKHSKQSTSNVQQPGSKGHRGRADMDETENKRKGVTPPVEDQSVETSPEPVRQGARASSSKGKKKAT